MLRLVAKSNKRFAVHIDIGTAFSRLIGVRTTANRMNPRIPFAACPKSIDKNIIRSIGYRTNANMCTHRTTMSICRYQCNIRKSTCGFHNLSFLGTKYPKNITDPILAQYTCQLFIFRLFLLTILIYKAIISFPSQFRDSIPEHHTTKMRIILNSLTQI